MIRIGKTAAVLVAAVCVASVSVPGLAAEPMQQGNIPYLSGGIGIDDRQDVESQARNYNLLIMNANRTGQLAVDSSFVIKNRNGGEVINVADAGPLFYVKLPPGQYTITATSGDQTQTRTVQISSRGSKRLFLTWQQD
jgi:hypothetical protein